ncbi:MAG: SHOCT domain-containing protein [Bacteroidales bacterium]|nr:SHOCT domain-containing protein [Bacteroidales bacterium]
MKEKKYSEATVVGIVLIIFSILAAVVSNTVHPPEQAVDTINAISSLITLIIRVACIFWIVSIAKGLNRNQLSWGVFAFFLPSIALIIIGQTKEKKVESNFKSLDASKNFIDENNIINTKTKTIADQKNILTELKHKGILTNDEYNEKLGQLLQQEENIRKKMNNESIQKLVEKKIRPIIEKLSELKANNVLSDEEFKKKENELIKRITEEIQDKLKKNSQIEELGFTKIEKKDLSGVEIMGVTKLESKLYTGSAILKSKKTKIIKTYNEAELKNIIVNGKTSDYWIIT